MLTLLAIIPSIILLIFIYKKDKKEKEPFKILLLCLFMGILTAIPAVIIETIEDEIVSSFFSEGSFYYAILDGFIVAALTEEFCKYLFLKWATYKSKYFDCMFDGIVYSVFVSLGFATLENLLYVFEGGIGIAIVRMLTAVPGHMCFAVYMGYYYSKAKLADVKGDRIELKKNKKKALLVPMLIHGVYDCLIMFEEDAVGDDFVSMAVMLWLVCVIALFISTFIFVSKASKNDEYILISPSGDSKVINFNYVSEWKCSNNHICRGNYCAFCGEKRLQLAEWICPSCKERAYYNFCPRCGHKKM